LGDFNLPGVVDWENLHCSKSADHPSTIFRNFFIEKQLIQHVTEPTGVRRGQWDSLLDLVLTRQPDMVENIEHLPGLGESDHSVLIVRVITRDTPVCSAMSEKKPVYRKANFENMIESFRRTNIVEDVEDISVEEMWETV
jgi:hypothetical protein